MTDSSSQLETRVARLETHMEHMTSAVSRILDELKSLRASTDEKFERVNERISALHVAMTEKFGVINEKLGEIKVWALTLLGGGLGFGILGVIARALHWI